MSITKKLAAETLDALNDVHYKIWQLVEKNAPIDTGSETSVGEFCDRFEYFFEGCGEGQRYAGDEVLNGMSYIVKHQWPQSIIAVDNLLSIYREMRESGFDLDSVYGRSSEMFDDEDNELDED